MEHMLYRMSFAQLLTLIETRNERERKAYEAAEEAAREREDGGYDPGPRPPRPKDLNNPDDLPTVSEIQRLFGGGGMVG
jgi:hypothetical protein